MKTAIIIPARYGSTRFPGKPMALLKGKAMIHHVYDIARTAAATHAGATVHIATDDSRIADFCREYSIPALMTSPDCATGTDRVMDAASQLETNPDFIINLQGDAPLTPPDFVSALIDTFVNNKEADIITPMTQLSWEELDQLRNNKKTTPFSGTTAVINNSGRALWFSKNIIPAIRKEDRSTPLSPIYRHIGLYGYKRTSLEKYIALPPSHYETLEGLEQLRALENGMTIQTVVVDYKGRPAMTGIDSPEDLARAEQLLS
ncbi:MAG TPA: 3-deoxy-manno-octulosonate cytidylyltransferase [Alphaproteobacteria bacterium]|nr:3-deoxy-manno-octulosonate cytidylyltransferase [Alphaproteobacteria bacterium]HNS43846.1 3-deoxy-manno-octulosonate cytidylyltransferase [Alphaproteobacteria bacterium]